MIMNSKLSKLHAIVFLSVSLFGCISEKPRDLKLNKVSLHGVSVITGKEIDNGRYNELGESIPRLKLDVVSSNDLLMLAKEKELAVRAETYFCDSPDLKVLMNRSEVLVDGVSIEELRFSDKEAIQANKSGKYIYSLYIGLYSPKIDGGSIQYSEYDLVKELSDICLVVEARSMIGGYRSNVLRISSGEIANAVKPLIGKKK